MATVPAAPTRRQFEWVCGKKISACAAKSDVAGSCGHGTGAVVVQSVMHSPSRKRRPKSTFFYWLFEQIKMKTYFKLYHLVKKDSFQKYSLVVDQQWASGYSLVVDQQCGYILKYVKYSLFITLSTALKFSSKFFRKRSFFDQNQQLLVDSFERILRALFIAKCPYISFSHFLFLRHRIMCWPRPLPKG